MQRGAQAAVFAAVIALTGCTNAGTQQEDGQSSSPADAPSASSSPAPSSSSPATPSSTASGAATGGSETAGISLGDAGSIVTDQYGGEVIGVEDDDFRGTPAWEVEVKDSSEGRIEVKVDKATGEILDLEQD